MKTKIFNLLLAGIISGVLFTACSKNDVTEQIAANANNANNANSTAKPSGLTASILNQDLKITSAIDNGTDITQQFNAFTFRFVGNYPGGQAQVWNDLLAQAGSWSSASESTDFTISYPTDIFNQLAFLNRTWTIAQSSENFFRLIGADGDQVDMTTKPR
jgi:hypothetical protein